MSIKIFVSHSAIDEKLAGALVDCIFSCMILEDEEVRCTSVPGHKLGIGSDAAQILRDELDETGVVIGLLTGNAIKSSWVLFELGATWGAQKKIQPLIADDINYSDLPGPLTGKHAAKLSEKNDLIQFIAELSSTVKAKTRTPAKIDSAIDRLIKENATYSKIILSSKSPEKVETKINVSEPTISGMKYSELKNILMNEKIKVPPKHSGKDKEFEIDLFSLFIGNHTILGDGLQSNWEHSSAGGFMYNQLGLKLLPFDLVKFEKLPAAQARHFKRIVLSPNGQKFIAHFKRLQNAKE